MSDINNILEDTNSRMQKSVNSLQNDLQTVRTGRANSALVENIVVDYYGSPTQLSHLSSITIPEARLIMIQPWDKQSIPDIERAILSSELGLNPTNDGQALRITIPELTEERRKELVKLVGGKIEDGNIAIRNIRRDAISSLRELEKDGDISQDDSRNSQSKIQEITDAFSKDILEIKAIKETEIMAV